MDTDAIRPDKGYSVMAWLTSGSALVIDGQAFRESTDEGRRTILRNAALLHLKNLKEFLARTDTAYLLEWAEKTGALQMTLHEEGEVAIKDSRNALKAFGNLGEGVAELEGKTDG